MSAKIAIELTPAQARIVFAVCRQHVRWLYGRATAAHKGDIDEMRELLITLRRSINDAQPAYPTQLADMRSAPGSGAQRTVDVILRNPEINGSDDNDDVIPLWRTLSVCIIVAISLVILALLGD